jgi:hypothetical protein
MFLDCCLSQFNTEKLLTIKSNCLVATQQDFCSNALHFDQVHLNANNASILHTIERVAANPSQMAVQSQVCDCVHELDGK